MYSVVNDDRIECKTNDLKSSTSNCVYRSTIICQQTAIIFDQGTRTRVKHTESKHSVPSPNGSCHPPCQLPHAVFPRNLIGLTFAIGRTSPNKSCNDLTSRLVDELIEFTDKHTSRQPKTELYWVYAAVGIVLESLHMLWQYVMIRKLKRRSSNVIWT